MTKLTQNREISDQNTDLWTWDYSSLHTLHTEVKYVGHEGVVFRLFLLNNDNLGPRSVNLQDEYFMIYNKF